MLICAERFHAVVLRQSSGRERKIFEKYKKPKNCVRVCVCACVRVCVYMG